MTGAYRFSVIPAGAITDPRLLGHPRALQVLCLLGRHTDDMGWCRRSQTKMAQELACARSTIQASLDTLYEAGWVERRLEGRGSVAPDPDKAPFAAHSYRVILDRDALPERLAGAEAATEKTAEGVPDTPAPPGGVPAPPAPGADAGPAPLEQTPCEPEREAHARDGAARCEPAPTVAERGLTVDAAWSALGKVWPAFAAQSEALARHELVGLTASERKVAVDRVPTFLAFHKATQGKGKLPFLHNYLGEKHRWQSLPQAKPATVVVDAKFVGSFDRPWWWLWFEAVERLGEALRDRRSQQSIWLADKGARASKGLGWKVEPGRLAEIEAAAMRLTQIPVEGAEFEAWRKALYQRGVTLPMPDVAKWIYVPSQWPPDERERDAALRDAADVVMGEGR